MGSCTTQSHGMLYINGVSEDLFCRGFEWISPYSSRHHAQLFTSKRSTFIQLHVNNLWKESGKRKPLPEKQEWFPADLNVSLLTHSVLQGDTHMLYQLKWANLYQWSFKCIRWIEERESSRLRRSHQVISWPHRSQQPAATFRRLPSSTSG